MPTRSQAAAAATLLLLTLIHSSSFTTAATTSTSTTKASTTSGTEEEVHDTHHETVDFAEKLSMTLLTLALAAMAEVFLHHYHTVGRFLPASGAFIIIGAIIGKAVDWTNNADLEQGLEFPAKYFTLFFLPPIMFEAGYCIKQSLFYRNIQAISAFAILGTIITTFFTAGVLYEMAPVVSDFKFDSFSECVAFSAIISAVDPVATLATFKALTVDRRLDILVFGESVVNDACAIVIYRAFRSFMQESNTNAGSIAKAIGSFFAVSLGSILIGILMGLVTALCLKVARVRDQPVMECIMFFCTTWTGFLLAEVCSFSGIISALVCGFMCAHYAKSNLSPQGQDYTRVWYSILAQFSEMTVFVLCGVVMLLEKQKHHALLSFTVLIIILLARALNIFPISYWCNKHRYHKIPLNHQIVIWWSGLRGAIAIALILDLASIVPDEHGRTLRSITFHMVSITVFIFGGLTPTFLDFMKIDMGPKVLKTPKESVSPYMMQMKVKWANFNDKYIANFVKLPPMTLQEKKMSFRHAHEEGLMRKAWETPLEDVKEVSNVDLTDVPANDSDDDELLESARVRGGVQPLPASESAEVLMQKGYSQGEIEAMTESQRQAAGSMASIEDGAAKPNRRPTGVDISTTDMPPDTKTDGVDM